MAAGDNWINCEDSRKNLSPDELFRLLIYDDGEGNPVLHTNTEGTELEPYFNCDTRQNLGIAQVFRDLILEDADGKPYLNTTSSS